VVPGIGKPFPAGAGQRLPLRLTNTTSLPRWIGAPHPRTRCTLRAPGRGRTGILRDEQAGTANAGLRPGVRQTRAGGRNEPHK